MNKKLLIFDVDNTLFHVHKTEDGGLDYTEDFRPGTEKFLESLRGQNFRIALATNQGGVGLRLWMEEGGWGQPNKLPTQNEARQRIERIRDKVQTLVKKPVAMFVSYRFRSKGGRWGPTPFISTTLAAETAAAYSDDPMVKTPLSEPPEWSKNWRKPYPGMLQAAMKHCRAKPEDTTMIGDSDEDKLAARAANVMFLHIDQVLEDGLAIATSNLALSQLSSSTSS